ncbi:MAG: alanine racemase [Ignavibacteriales bacterium]|nr:alanine racemase [Ignavibacteriales bacterium]
MAVSRRRFLQSSVGVPTLASWKPLLQESFKRRDSSFDPWIEVHRSNLEHNVSEISRLVNERPILAVIKNNGYGLGIVNVARILEPQKAIHGFAVVKLQEAITLRDAGIKKPILLLGPFDDEELYEMVEREVMPMVYTPLGPTFDKLARKTGKKVEVHFCIDTGIGRVGVPYHKATALIQEVANRGAVAVGGVMMTFTEDSQFDAEQFRRFQGTCDSIEKAGIRLGRRHAVSSFGLFQHRDKFLDMVRPGMAIFGIYPEKEFRLAGTMNLRPAVSLKARVIYVKQLSKGESAGYNRSFVAGEDVWVATLPVGHADGVPREVTKGARVRIGDGLFPIVAISASHCITNLGESTNVNIGDEAAVFDWQENSRPEDVAAACNGSVYDLTMHLNPLLPRKVV